MRVTILPEFPPVYDYADPTGTVAQNTKLKGLTTGGLTRILEAGMLLSVVYYDSRYRLIQSVTGNHPGGTDNVTTEYFNVVPPNVKKVTRNHSTSIANKDILEEYTYDHMDRLLTTTTTIDGNPSTITHTYNEIGELIKKEVGGGLQSIDYRYNIRGWLTHINNGTALDAGENDEFGMELKYTDAGQYNGNIDKMTWATLDDTGSFDQKEYSYSYDNLSRLKKAIYSSSSENNYYNVGGFDNGIKYDLNGNILNLTRNYQGASADNLMYSYEGNQLVNVTDGANDLVLFKDGNNNSNQEYFYDRNGNMISDANKSLTSIEYNYLNLPQIVNFLDDQSTPQTLNYTYDALGNKLAKVSSVGADIDYLPGIQYKNGSIDFLHHSVDRYQFSTNSYEYDLKDHLGNVRVSLDENATVIQRDDYYPFGLTFNSYTSGIENLYKYNGFEEQEETGWYDYIARQYDPALGRFLSVDPLADYMRRHSLIIMLLITLLDLLILMAWGQLQEIRTKNNRSKMISR
jgi:RHS repeat-associated protein